MRLEHRRPDYTGQQRTSAYPFVLWRDAHGVVHEANLYSNQALCEMWLATPSLLSLEIDGVVPPRAAVTCLFCVAWAARQAKAILAHAGIRRARLAESLRQARVALAPGLAQIPRNEGGPGEQLEEPLGGQHART